MIPRHRLVAVLAGTLVAATVSVPLAAHAADGTVAGTVRNPDGSVLENGYVSAFAYHQEDRDWDFVDSASIGDGGYSLNLAPGTYRLSAQDDDGQQVETYYERSADVESAADVVITSKQRRSADITLIAPARLAGTVKDEAGRALDEITVVVEAKDRDTGEWEWETSERTGRDGSYTLSTKPGTYRVVFEDSDGEYLTEYFQDTRDAAKAKPVTLASGKTVRIDAALAPAGRITGKISGSGASYGHVDVLDSAGRVVAESHYQDGEYQVGDLMAGSYKVAFDRGSGQSLTAGQYYRGKDETAGVEKADVVKVTVGKTVSGIDAAMKTGGVISVDVAQSDCLVTAFIDDGIRTTRATYSRSEGGRYDVTGLSTGSYVLGVDCDDEPGNGPQTLFYDASSTTGLTSDRAKADRIEVKALGATTNVPGRLTYVAGQEKKVTNTAAPTVPGTPQVGVPVKATSGTWSPSGTALAYQWLREGKPIKGATQQTYTPVAEDARTALSVQVTGSLQDHQPTTATSSGKTVQPGVVKNSAVPTITGKAARGETLKALPGTWSPSGLTYSYQWLRGGKPIAKATSSSYKLGTADLGAELAVRVTATRPGHTGATATSATTTVAKARPTVTVSSTAGKRKATLRISVKATSVTGTGKVRVTYGKKSKTLTLKKGKATSTWTGLRSGKRKFTIAYLGDGRLLAVTEQETVKVKK